MNQLRVSFCLALAMVAVLVTGVDLHAQGVFRRDRRAGAKPVVRDFTADEVRLSLIHI